MSTITNPCKLVPSAELALLDLLWNKGMAAFDTGTREDQIDFLLGCDQVAFGIGLCPNAMMEMKEYFEPAYNALIAEQQRHTQRDHKVVGVSPFTGRPQQPAAPAAQPVYGLGTTGRPLENEARAEGPQDTSAPVTIPLGYFTVRHPDSDEYETIQIKRAGPNSNLAGKIMAGHIKGPNNQTDYQMFCFIDETTGQVKLWGRFLNIDPRWPEAVRTVIGMDKERRIKAGKAYAQVSKRCMVCGLPLTTPESLDRGIGPVCATAGW